MIAPSRFHIFGGTFDPCQDGHVSVIRAFSFSDSCLVIAPTDQNPWKPSAPASLSDRAQMIRLVLSAEGISWTEDRPENGACWLLTFPYYRSVELLDYLRSNYTCPMTWIVGEDSIASVKDWKDWATRGCPVVGAPVTIDVHAEEIRSGAKPPHPAIQSYIKEHHLYPMACG